MEAVLLVVHLIVACGIIILVLIQPSEAGGFLGNSGTMSNLMAPRRSGDILSRLTTIFAGIFFCTSLILAVVAQHKAPAKSILDAVTDTPPTVEKTVDNAVDKKVEEKTAETPVVAKEVVKEKAVEKKVKAAKPDAPKAPISK